MLDCWGVYKVLELLAMAVLWGPQVQPVWVCICPVLLHPGYCSTPAAPAQAWPRDCFSSPHVMLNFMPFSSLAISRAPALRSALPGRSGMLTSAPYWQVLARGPPFGVGSTAPVGAPCIRSATPADLLG